MRHPVPVRFDAPRPLPDEKLSPRERLRDLRATLALVWQASPLHAGTYAATSLAGSALPAANLYVGKLLLDEVARAAQGQVTYRALLTLLAVQVALVVVGNLISTVQNASQQLLGDALQHSVSRRILDKATTLSVEAFENADTYDRLQQAWREVGSRPWGRHAARVPGGRGRDAGLGGRPDEHAGPLGAAAGDPGEHSRRDRQQPLRGGRLPDAAPPDARLARAELPGQPPDERRAGQGGAPLRLRGYLLGRWREYYLGFRRQLVTLVRRRSAWGFGAGLLSALLIGLASALILRRAADGQISVGDFSVFVLGITQIQGTVSSLLNGFSAIYQNLLYMRNLFAFLELPTRDLDAGEVWSGPIHTIEFRDVSFRYP